ncbi:unnamed protein product, partial [marine sediment metagenome]
GSTRHEPSRVGDDDGLVIREGAASVVLVGWIAADLSAGGDA